MHFERFGRPDSGRCCALEVASPEVTCPTCNAAAIVKLSFTNICSRMGHITDRLAATPLEQAALVSLKLDPFNS